MTCVAVQKQREQGYAKDGNDGPGPLLCLMALFCDPGATAGPFRAVDRAHGDFCPRCRNNPVIKHGRYRKHLQRYLCKDCGRTFNDKTDTILHYRHIWMGNWMLALWAFLYGPPNGASINHIAESMGCTCGSTYYIIRRMMDKMRGLPEGIILSGTSETDEGYIRAGSKGVPLAGNGGERIVPSRRGLPRGPGRSAIEKNTQMMTVCHQRATENEPGLTILEVSVNDGRTLAGRTAKKFEREPMVITDENTAYKSPGEAGYDHPTVNHGEDGLRLGGGSQWNPHKQLRVQGGPAQMVIGKTPGVPASGTWNRTSSRSSSSTTTATTVSTEGSWRRRPLYWTSTRGGRPDPGPSIANNAYPVLIRMFLKRFIFHQHHPPMWALSYRLDFFRPATGSAAHHIRNMSDCQSSLRTSMPTA